MTLAGAGAVGEESLDVSAAKPVEAPVWTVGGRGARYLCLPACDGDASDGGADPGDFNAVGMGGAGALTDLGLVVSG